VFHVGVLLRNGVVFHSIAEKILLDPRDPDATVELMLQLARMEAGPGDPRRRAEKAKCRLLGLPQNQYCGRGWQWSRTTDGTACRVPCESERDLMRCLLTWRNQGHRWADVDRLTQQAGFRNRRKKKYPLRTLRRFYDAAWKMRQELGVPDTDRPAENGGNGRTTEP